MINVFITATDYLITATESVSLVQVETDNVVFTVTNQVSNFDITTTPMPVITFSTGGAGFDFAVKHRSDWSSGETYSRNDVVRYNYSIYICNIDPLGQLVSTTPPPQDLVNWELFVNNEWPRSSLTVTNTLTVGSLIAQTITANTATINSNFYLNGLKYPSSRGNYGQILVTNGTDRAEWQTLGDLVYWNLSSDLQTNGYNIITGYRQGVPNPQLTIGSGDSAHLNSYIRFNQGGDTVTVKGSTVFIDSINASSLQSSNDITLGGTLKSASFATPVNVGYGLRFPDGSVMTTTNVGSGGVVNIASELYLGVIRVGGYLLIDPATGILSVDVGNLPTTYQLPTATASTLGGVKIGAGLAMTGPSNDILTVTTTTSFGRVSLTEDMVTNGYKIKNIPVDNQYTAYVDINAGNIDIHATEGSNITLGGAASTVYHAQRIELTAPVTRVGYDINDTELRVGRIYNYSGVGPPLFPAGTQYGDQTVQLTAYIPNDMGPVYGGTMLTNGLDFNNLTFAVDYNL